MAKHHDLEQPYAIHQFAFASNTDPALDVTNDVAPLKGWIDTSTSPATLKYRNAADSAWSGLQVEGAATAYGSNANAVASVSAGGASTSVSRADHVHLGVRSIAHTSNTYAGPITLVAAGAVGITSPASGTFTISAATSSAGGGAGGGSEPDAFVGAKAYSAVTQTINTTTAAVILASEEYDSDGFHDLVTENTKMTVPAGKGGKYLLAAGTFGNNTDAGSMWFRKNGTDELRGRNSMNDESGGHYTAHAIVVELAAGEYVEFMITSAANITYGHATLPGAQSWFAISLIGA